MYIAYSFIIFIQLGNFYFLIAEFGLFALMLLIDIFEIIYSLYFIFLFLLIFCLLLFILVLIPASSAFLKNWFYYYFVCSIFPLILKIVKPLSSLLVIILEIWACTRTLKVINVFFFNLLQAIQRLYNALTSIIIVHIQLIYYCS